MKVRYSQFCIEHMLESHGSGDKNVGSDSRDN